MPIDLKKSSKAVFLGFTMPQLAVMAGALGTVAFIYFSDSGVVRTTADETPGFGGGNKQIKPPAERCLLQEDDKFTNECGEGIRVLHCGPMQVATDNIRGHTCHEANLNPGASFSIAGQIGTIGACYRSEKLYVQPGNGRDYICL